MSCTPRLLRTPTGLLLVAVVVSAICAMWIAWRTDAFGATQSPAAPRSYLGAYSKAGRAKSHDPRPSKGHSSSVLSPQQQFPVDGTDVQDAEQIAIQHWGWAPCGGVVGLEWSTLDGSVNAVSTWWNPQSAYGNAAANSDCQVTLNNTQVFDWPMLCTIVVHEFGHLTGHQHVTDITDVMYPVYVNPIDACKTPDPAGVSNGAPAAVASSSGSGGTGPSKGGTGSSKGTTGSSKGKGKGKSAGKSQSGRQHSPGSSKSGRGHH